MNTKPTYEDLVQQVRELENDVSKLKGTEEILINRSHYYQSLLQSLSELILIIDPDYRITDVNEAFLQTSGFKRENVIGRHCYELEHGYNQPCDQYNEVCRVNQVLETGQPSHYRHGHLHGDDSKVLMDIYLSPIRDRKGNITHLVKSTRDITGLITIEKALQDSEEKYRNLFEHANDSIFIIDPATRRFLDVNKNAAIRLGYAREELLQLSIDDIDTPMAAKRNQSIISELCETGSVIFEHAHLKKDNTEIPVEISSRVVEYGGQKVFQSIVRDISERRRVADTLRVERDKAQRVLDIAGVIFIIISIDQRVAMVNKKGCNILGFGEEEIIGKNWFDTFVPETMRQALKKEFSRLLAGEIEPIEYFENPVVTKTGEKRFIAWNNTVLRDDTGKIIGTLSSGTDITERRIADEALKDSEAHWRSITENSPDYIMTLDTDGKILFINHTLPEFTRDQVLGTSFFDYALPKYKRTTEQCFQNVLNTGKADKFESVYENFNGELKYFESNVGPIFKLDKVVGLTVSSRDITLRKKAEAVLQKSHTELERRVEERTTELLKSNIRLTHEVAERRRTEEALRRLSSKIMEAHEEESKRIGQELHDAFSQTLSAIKFRLEGAILQIPRHDSAEIAESLESMVPLIQAAIQEIRNISRNLWPSMLDDLGILPTLSWLCKNFETMHPSIRIDKQFEQQQTEVPDALRIVIFRILQEALNNIGKHSGADRVRVSLNRTEKEIELNIYDNGTGFDSSNVLEGKKKVKGLGIASMKDRADLSGGTFSISSIPGSGTIVQVSWRLEKGDG